MYRVLKIQNQQDPEFIKITDNDLPCHDFLCISPNHTIYYSRLPIKFNKTMQQKFGLNLSGDVCIVRNDENGVSVDIESDIMEKLPSLLEVDAIMRQDYVQSCINNGAILM